MTNLNSLTKIIYTTLGRCAYWAILIYLVILGCHSRESKYSHPVGFIDENGALGDKGFKTCDTTIFQYYNSFPHAGYKFGKKALRDSVTQNFIKETDESGYLTIRFIINCQGLAGRYEIIENDINLRPTKFNEKLKFQLFNIISHLKSWSPLLLDNKPRDSYMYLTFKIDNGKIVEILP